MPKLFIHALGCKTNHYENQALAQQLSNHNFELVTTVDQADVAILNTCTVTAEAGRKSRQYLRRMKKKNPKAVIVAMGCHTQLENSEDCDIVVGTGSRNSLLSMINEKLAINTIDDDFSISLETDLKEIGRASKEKEYEELGIVSQQEDTRAQIKIQDGCNAFCTYCAIPFARGRTRSRKRENIYKEAEALVKNGHKEVVLTGIHICSFEKEIGRNSDALAELCLELNNIRGLERIRLGSLEPLSVTPSFLEILQKADKVCPHFHLSLQSGSDSVLARMHRLYNTQQYLERVNLLRNIYQRPAITTDIMVGFPEETDQEFQESLDFVKKIKFSRIHIFPYSRRPGTLAAKMQQVHGDIVKERVDKMLDLGCYLAEQFSDNFLNKTVEVILEDIVGDYIRGYTERYVRAYIPRDQGFSGESKKVFISKTENGDIFGKLVC